MSDHEFTEGILEDFGFSDMDMPTYEVFDQMADLIDSGGEKTMISDSEHREERPAYRPTNLPEFVPDRAAILYGLRQHGIDAPESVGIKRETIRKLLDGSTRRPTASLMMQLARLFDCDVEDLMREA